MPNFLLTVQYDGSNYHGWIKQTNQKTIQGELNKAISKVTKIKEIKTLGASKTDAGVHALDQKVLLFLDFEPNLELFQIAINKALPEDIRIKNIKIVESDFNIRNVKEKTYIYQINDSDYDIKTNRFEMNWKYKSIDLEKLQNIFNLFVGEHDFKLFSGLSTLEIDKSNINTIRTIKSINVFKENDRIKIEFKAKGFIRYQIRMIVQSALNCYVNKKMNEDLIKELLNGKGKKPPFNSISKGLILKEIVF